MIDPSKLLPSAGKLVGQIKKEKKEAKKAAAKIVKKGTANLKNFISFSLFTWFKIYILLSFSLQTNNLYLLRGSQRRFW